MISSLEVDSERRLVVVAVVVVVVVNEMKWNEMKSAMI